MDFLNGDHIRVITPITTDGVIPKLDEQGTQAYKETFLPLSAKKFIESQNHELPNHLKKIIEVVRNDVAQPAAEPAETADQVGGKKVSPPGETASQYTRKK
jgi:hypothetical protein